MKNNPISLKNIIISLPTALLLIGGFCLLQSNFGTFVDGSKWKKLLDVAGNAIFTGGIFAVIVKYMQFMKIFKDELIEIIYEAQYLEKRNDLPEIWEKVSKVMFHNKFPKISKTIMHDVKCMYFPTDHVHYYDDYEQTIEIELIDSVLQKVKVVQTSNYIVYPKDRKANMPHVSKNSLKFNTNKSEVSFKIIKYVVNGMEVAPTIREEVSDGSLITTYSAELVGGVDAYKFETIVEKIYSLKYDNIIGQSKEFIINNFSLDIYLKGDLMVDFNSFGTLKSFVNKSRFKDKHYMRYEYNGLIYPKQGYFMIVKLK